MIDTLALSYSLKWLERALDYEKRGLMRLATRCLEKGCDLERMAYGYPPIYEFKQLFPKKEEETYLAKRRNGEIEDDWFDISVKREYSEDEELPPGTVEVFNPYHRL